MLEQIVAVTSIALVVGALALLFTERKKFFYIPKEIQEAVDLQMQPLWTAVSGTFLIQKMFWKQSSRR